MLRVVWSWTGDADVSVGRRGGGRLVDFDFRWKRYAGDADDGCGGPAVGGTGEVGGGGGGGGSACASVVGRGDMGFCGCAGGGGGGVSEAGNVGDPVDSLEGERLGEEVGLRILCFLKKID